MTETERPTAEVASAKQPTADLLLEIGVEELPARFCAPALQQLAEHAATRLREARLAHGVVETLGTPRRLALLARGLTLSQEPRETVNRGPATRVAFDAEGRPTRAAEGFARGQGIAVAELRRETAENGQEYVVAARHEAGQEAMALLPAILHDLVLGLEFPTSMRWGSGSIRYARPIRWLLGLLGDQPVPFAVGDVASGTGTYGHRTLAAPGLHPVPSAGAYVETCASVGVSVDPARRRATIWGQVQAVATEVGGRVPPDEELLDEVTWLVEQPLAFAGSFDADFLAVPAPVLVTSMRENQRYFPVYAQGADGDTDGNDTLLPAFIAVSNNARASLDNVRHGNEKVLRARLSDARFFWDEDRRRPLSARLDDLKDVTFHAGLGSQYDRTRRIEWLSRVVAASLGYDAATEESTGETARLSKCDLVTAMVGEFPSLQGVMGRAYALADGHDPLVADGILEHYLPRYAGDTLPTSATGVAVGLADRLDTLMGFFGLGLVPTGSADPFALRRAALGFVTIVVDGGLRVSLRTLIDAARAGYTGVGTDGETGGAAPPPSAMEEAVPALLEFLHARLDGLLRERGRRYDVVDAVLAADDDDPADASVRAMALQHSLDRPAFAAVAAAFKRIANIVRKVRAEGAVAPALDAATSDDDMSPAPSAPPAERTLWEAFERVRPDAEASLSEGRYEDFYDVVTVLKDPVDTFFDAVLVMDPDPDVRRARLALLGRIADLLTRPADLTKVVSG